MSTFPATMGQNYGPDDGSLWAGGERGDHPGSICAGAAAKNPAAA